MIEFAQPLALWTGLTIALPILAHLAFRRIAHKLSFSSLRFIRPSPIPRSGRRNPNDLLLLLLRLLLFVLITCLIADPYWKDNNYQAISSSGKPENLFLIDTTPSMGGWGAWNDVLSEIRTRLSEGKVENYGLLTYQNGSLQEWPLGTPVEDLFSAMDSIEIQNSPAGLQVMIDRAPELFSTGSTRKKIILVSDFQKSSWQEVSGDFSNEGIELELCPVGHGASPWMQRVGNYAVIDARAAPGRDGKVRVWAALRNFNQDRVDLNVSIVAGGKRKETSQVSLSPQSTEQIQFILPAEDYAHAVVKIDGNDSLSADDNQSLWTLPPLPRTFGFWKNSNDDKTDILEEEFLRAAMLSAGNNPWDRWVQNNEKAQELRNGFEGSPLDLLLVLGVAGWFEDEGLALSLDTHLKTGGTAMITPPEDSHIRMNNALKQSGLLDFIFAGVNRTAYRMKPYRIEVLPEESGLTKVFSGDSVRDLYLSQIRKFIKVNEGESVEVPLYDRSGHPLVLIRNFPSGGKLVFFTFRLVPEWTDLPMRNSFLPLLVELGGLNKREQGGAGILRLQAGDENNLHEASLDSQRIGLFQLGEQRIEIVHPLLESMPELMAKNELIDALSGGQLISDNESTLDDVKETNNAQSLWHLFALTAAILLYVEMILSAPFALTRDKPEVASG